MTTTTQTADDAVSFAAFKIWLQARQAAATAAMATTTGEEFGKHCDTLILTVDALRTVAFFEHQGRD